MTRITTHVLDTAAGVPAAGVGVTLLRVGAGGDTTELGRAVTDADGRVGAGAAAGVGLGAGADAGVGAGGGFPPVAGPCLCRLVFDVAGHLGREAAFFPEVSVTFRVEPAREHLHVPLLLSPYGYSVYRGS